MSESLFNLIDESTVENVNLFNRIKNRLFKDYAHGKKIIHKQGLWSPLNEITKQLFGSRLDKKSFNILYYDIDNNNKGYINKKQFNIVAKCLIMSVIAHLEKKHPIPGREISLCMENRELPEQMEIIDTLTNDEIDTYKKKLLNSRKYKNNYKKKYQPYKNKKKFKPNKKNNKDIEPYLIEIDSDND